MISRSRTWPGACVVALIAFSSGLIALAPATLFDRIISSYSDGKVRLSAARGTLWVGEGRVELRNAQGHSNFTRTLAWRLLPARLAHAQLAYEINLNQAGHIPLAISPWPSRVELFDAKIVLPASLIGMAVPRLTPLRLTGDLRIHIHRLNVEPDKLRGDVRMQWQNAGSELSPISPLGEYEFRFDGEESKAQLTLRTVRGPLQLDGRSDWTQGKNPVTAVTARVSPQEQQTLAPLLRLIAVERMDGSFELRAN